MCDRVFVDCASGFDRRSSSSLMAVTHWSKCLSLSGEQNTSVSKLGSNRPDRMSNLIDNRLTDYCSLSQTEVITATQTECSLLLPQREA